MALVLGQYVKPSPVNLQASNPGFGTPAASGFGSGTQNSLGYPSLGGQSPNAAGFINPQTQLAGSVKISPSAGLPAAPFKPPTTAQIIPITGGGGSNTAGSGATWSDVNSVTPNYTPGDSAYGPAQQGTIDANWLQNYLENDQQYKADLARISAQGGNYLDAFTAAAQAAEIAYGLPFDPNAAEQAGYRFPSLTDPVTGNPISMGPLFAALSDPATRQAAQSNPYSRYAQTLHGYNDLLAQQDSAMGATGMSRSGDYMSGEGDYAGGYQHQQAQWQRDTANYASMQDFLGQLNTGYSNYSGQLDSLQTALQTARQNDLSKALAMINAGLLKPPSSLPNNPGGGSFQGGTFGAGSTGTLGATGLTNPQYANTPTGQAMAAAARAAGVSSGAGGVLTSGGQGTNYQAAVQAGPGDMTGWGTGGGWGSFGWGGSGSSADRAPANDGSYDAWVAAGGYNPIAIPDTGTALDQAQQVSAQQFQNDPAALAILKQLSPDIQNWRT